jgi:hypothetical protein
MTTRFKSEYDPLEAFYLRVRLLRPMFGRWDACDPVSHAILDIVEAQRELADAIANFAEYGVGGDATTIKAAIEARHAAGEKLMQALEDRDCWPNPALGKG